MPRAQCYYEILGISETATTDEVKKAYKSLALVWHPDKNQSNLEEAHAKFQVILKAYETLSDNREREWYDRHKDQILSDGNKDDASANCLNLFQYFSSACYANFDDAEDGFYTIYRGVFDQIAEEERQALQQATRLAKNKNTTTSNKSTNLDDISNILPTFGTSESHYEDVVRPFYAYWSSFCTNLTFDVLDKYNTLEAENRRIVRAMEKENKKIKDAARKERNSNVRNLVEFVKKRDKRLKAHKLLVEQQNELNRQKTAEKQRQQREKSLKETSEYKPNAYLDMDDVERQLLELENEYQDLKKSKRARRRRNQLDDKDEVDCDVNDGTGDGDGADRQEALGGERNTSNDGDVTANGEHSRDCDVIKLHDDNDDDDERADSDEDDEDDEEEDDSFYCAACNKEFQTINAFENHEASKKHKQNVQKLTKLLKAEEVKLNNK